MHYNELIIFIFAFLFFRELKLLVSVINASMYKYTAGIILTSKVICITYKSI